MKTEVEATFPDIDKDEVRATLNSCGAYCVREDRLMRRKVYNPPVKDADWFRVRDEGDVITMSYKKLLDRSAEGMREIEVEVSDFDATCQIIERTGAVFGAYQETRRESWTLDGVEIEIDEWPWIPPFVEIEGEREAHVRDVAERLGFVWGDALFGSVENVYQRYYDVTEDEVNGWPEIVFGPVPEWLGKRRKGRA